MSQKNTFKSFIYTSLIVLIWILPLVGGINEEFWLIDDNSLLNTPQLRSELNFQHLKTIFTPGYQVDYYPVRDLTHWLEIKLLGGDPKGTNGGIFRFINILLFLCCGMILFLIVHKFNVELTQCRIFVLIWLFNPIHLETVMWISARKDILAILFGLMSYYLYLRRLFILAVIAALMCYLSKATFVLIPLVGLIFIYLKKWKVDLKQKYFVIGSSLLSVIFAVLQTWFYSKVNNMTFDYTLEYRIQAAITALGKEALGTIIPYFNVLDLRNSGEWLSINFEFFYFGFFLLIVSFLIFIKYRDNKYVFIAIGLLLAVYLPTSGIIFKHRNFYSTRYFEPVYLLFVLIMAVLPSQFHLNKEKLNKISMLLFLYLFCSWYYFSSNYHSSLDMTLRAAKMYPENMSLKVFYYQDLLRMQRWGKVTESQKQEIKLLEGELKIRCIDLSEDKKYPNQDLCLEYIKHLEFVNDKQYSKEQLLDLHKRYSNLDLILGKAIDLKSESRFSTELNRINVWKNLCLSSKHEDAKDFLKEQFEKGLLDVIGIREYLADGDVVDHLRGENKKLLDCLNSK